MCVGLQGVRTGELLGGQLLFLLCRDMTAELAVSFTHGCVITFTAFRLAFKITSINADHGVCGKSVIGSGSVTMLSCAQTSQVISQVP